MKSSISVTVLLLTGTACWPALAQQTSSNVAPAPVPVPTSEQAGAADGAPSIPNSQVQSQQGIGDIVVTAQKRSENLQRTPAAVTAVTGDMLVRSGITDLRTLQVAVPGARFQQEGNSTQVFLRGVGANYDGANVDPAVAFNFNGIALPREATSIGLFDVDRIEVLPGPQGTLYGRDAIGGTINVAAKRPSQEQETTGLLEVGNYRAVHTTVTENVPLNDDLAIRGAVDYAYNHGYMTDHSFSQDDLSTRLGLSYKPTTDLRVYVWGAYTNVNGNPANVVNKGFDPNTGQLSENAYLHDNPYDTSRTGSLAALAPFGQPVPASRSFHVYATGAEVQLNLSKNLTLTYIPGYNYTNTKESNYWLGAIPGEQAAKYRDISQELRLAGDYSRLNWLVGLYGYRQVNSGNAGLFFGTPIFFYVSHIDRNLIEGVAGYGQATYSVTDKLRLTVGGRYSTDKRTGRGATSPINGLPFSFDKSYSHFDYKAGVQYDIASRAMVYAAYQTGYEPGTYNEIASTPTTSNAVKPQTIKAITAGIKTRFFDNRLQINNEAFFYRYFNFFIQSIDLNVVYNPVFNAQQVNIPGDQLDVIFAPDQDNRLGFSVSYIHARNKHFTTPAGANFDGLSPIYAADWTISGNVSHDFHLRSGYVQASTNARYESTRWASYTHAFGTRQGPTAKLDASVTYYPDNQRWSVGLFGKNLTNVATIAAAAASGIPGPASAYLEPPRTFGGRATVKF